MEAVGDGLPDGGLRRDNRGPVPVAGGGRSSDQPVRGPGGGVVGLAVRGRVVGAAVVVPRGVRGNRLLWGHHCHQPFRLAPRRRFGPHPAARFRGRLHRGPVGVAHSGHLPGAGDAQRGGDVPHAGQTVLLVHRRLRGAPVGASDRPTGLDEPSGRAGVQVQPPADRGGGGAGTGGGPQRRPQPGGPGGAGGGGDPIVRCDQRDQRAPDPGAGVRLGRGLRGTGWGPAGVGHPSGGGGQLRPVPQPGLLRRRHRRRGGVHDRRGVRGRAAHRRAVVH